MLRGVRRRLARFIPHTVAGYAALVFILISLGLGALSGRYTLVYRGGNVLLVTLDAGTLRALVVTEHFHAPAPPDCIWEDIFYPAPIPATGMVSRPAYSLAWGLPGIHRSFSSVAGTWWTFTLPLWCGFALGVAALSRLYRPRPAKVHNSRAALACMRTTATSPPNGTRWLTWTSGLASLAVLAVWLLSGWWTLTFSDGKSYHLDVRAGVVSYSTIPECVASLWESAPPARICPNREAFRLDWTIPHTANCAQSSIGIWQEFNLPLWLVLLVVSSPLIQATYRRFRHHFVPGTCAKCGYNLTGNLSGRCPECGTAVGF